MNELVDRFGRQHSYLRVSVTDRCNLRCVYCMPPEGIEVKKKDEILSFEEIYRICKILVGMGITKIRLTGGEPLVRKDLDQLVGMLSPLPGLQTIALTTNGVLLSAKAKALRDAGLKAVNISLDSLHADRFEAITLRNDWQKVMDGIDAASNVGFESIKLNVVVIRGRNEDELVDFVEFVRYRNLNVRFIEYMPFKDNKWDQSGVCSYKEMRDVIEQSCKLEPLPGHPSDVARDFRIAGGTGSVSFITSMTESFCATCNRLRITADGSIKSCLFYQPEVNFRQNLRDGCTDKQLKEMILYALENKPEEHPPMEELAQQANRAMVEIGG